MTAAANTMPNPIDRAGDIVTRAGAVLIELLERQAEVHDRLVEHLESKRAAVRTADVEAVGRICEVEKDLAIEIETLENRRRDVVRDLTAVLEPGRAEPLELVEVADRLAPDVGRRLRELRDRLRTTLTEAVRLSGIVNAAAEAIGRHINGVVDALGRVLAPPVTYGRRGRMNQTATTSARLDLRS